MRARTGYVNPPNTRLTDEKSLLNIRFKCRDEQILAIFLEDIVRTASREGFCSSCPQKHGEKNAKNSKRRNDQKNSNHRNRCMEKSSINHDFSSINEYNRLQVI